jgi:hypothetical protein
LTISFTSNGAPSGEAADGRFWHEWEVSRRSRYCRLREVTQTSPNQLE